MRLAWPDWDQHDVTRLVLRLQFGRDEPLSVRGPRRRTESHRILRREPVCHLTFGATKGRRQEDRELIPLLTLKRNVPSVRRPGRHRVIRWIARHAQRWPG